MLSCGKTPARTGYFSAEIELNRILEDQKDQVFYLEKSVTSEEGTLTKSFRSDSVNWDKEWSLFLQLDLNKPAWVGKYELDTLVTDSGWQVNYTTSNKGLAVQELTAYYAGKKCTGFEGVVVKENYLYKAVYTLNFAVGKSYSIDAQINQFFVGADEHFRVRGMLNY